MTDPELERLVAALRADPPGDPRVAALLDHLERQGGAQRGVVDFVVNVSHELRTPLNAILGYSELLEDELAGHDGGLVPDVRRIRAAGALVLDLVNDLLDLSKLEAGKLSLLPEDLAVRDVVDDVVATVERLVEEQGNRLEVVVAPAAGSVWADPLRLRQCLLNLVSNANKFTEDGVVRLVARPFGAEVAFEVIDDGVGMSAEELGRLFHRFEQARADTAHRHGGTGLGLALTRELVTRMGGRVEVTSAPGSGSTFRLVLPTA